MADLEKVLKGLECCCSMTGEACRQCPYDEECAKMIGSGSAHLCSDALELLREQPEQKHGHWVLDHDGMDWNIPAWRCSVCGCRNDNIPPNLEKTNPRRWSGSRFCPNCGAQMDEEVKQDD